MSQQKSKFNSILLHVSKVCGCLLLVYIIGFIGVYTLFVAPLFFSFGFKDKQVEILIGTSTSWLIKVKQGEGKQYVGSMNRAQQAYFYENNALATSVDALGLGIKTETKNYKYSTRATQTAAFSYAFSKDKTLKDYVGGVFITKEDASGAPGTISILCKIDDRPWFRFKPADEPAEPIYKNGEVICGKGTTELTR
ncbi:MAG: type IV pilin-like G/H family protein [Microcoleus sp.]